MRLLEEEGFTITLNESPSEKEGKSAGPEEVGAGCGPSMKVPPKRKGNSPALAAPDSASPPQ